MVCCVPARRGPVQGLVLLLLCLAASHHAWQQQMGATVTWWGLWVWVWVWVGGVVKGAA